MEKVTYFLCALVMFMLSSCGISSQEKEQMQRSLYLSLTDAFLAQDDFTVIAPDIILSNIEKGGWAGWDCSYHGTFSCSFDENGSHVTMRGVAGFSEDGHVATLSNGKFAIFFHHILIDYKIVDPKTSIYNLPCFDMGRG